LIRHAASLGGRTGSREEAQKTQERECLKPMGLSFFISLRLLRLFAAKSLLALGALRLLGRFLLFLLFRGQLGLIRLCFFVRLILVCHRTISLFTAFTEILEVTVALDARLY
jgi:hypothetical protein